MIALQRVPLVSMTKAPSMPAGAGAPHGLAPIHMNSSLAQQMPLPGFFFSARRALPSVDYPTLSQHLSFIPIFLFIRAVHPSLLVAERQANFVHAVYIIM